MLELWSVLNDVMRPDPWFVPFSTASGALTAHADVSETDAEYWIAVELPGVSLEGVKLAIDDDRLLLTVDKRATTEADKRNYHHIERRYGTVSRAFRLPKAVERDQVEATMRDGVLSIRLPKAEQARPRRIAVKVSTFGSGDSAPRQLTAEATDSTDEE
jgi:HSP20 family protein